MRALILVLAATVVGLAVSIVLHVDERPRYRHGVGPTLQVGSFLGDALGGESATYREKTSLRYIDFKVESAPRLPPFVPPYKVIGRAMRDARGEAFEGPTANLSYKHILTAHGWFPLMAPEVPEALDRVWIIRSIKPDVLTWRQKERDCWRIDLIDPALPEGADTVVAWLDPDIPVFGLLKWKRGGETWELLKAQSVGGAR